MTMSVRRITRSPTQLRVKPASRPSDAPSTIAMTTAAAAMVSVARAATSSRARMLRPSESAPRM